MLLNKCKEEYNNTIINSFPTVNIVEKSINAA